MAVLTDNLVLPVKEDSGFLPTHSLTNWWQWKIEESAIFRKRIFPRSTTLTYRSLFIWLQTIPNYGDAGSSNDDLLYIDPREF